MTSKFNTETMNTMKRVGKPTQKTANISTSKRQGTTKSIMSFLFIIYD
jgi:hypothetical protein